MGCQMPQFQIFNINQALNEVKIPKSAYDPVKGIFGLQCLSDDVLTDIETANKQLRIAELQSNLENEETQSQIKQEHLKFQKEKLSLAETTHTAEKIIQNLRENTERSKEANWHRDSSVTLAKAEFWDKLKQLDRVKNNPELLNNLNQQQADWLLHAPYANYTALGLWLTYQKLQHLQIYCDNAQKELQRPSQIVNAAQWLRTWLPTAIQPYISFDHYETFYKLYSTYLEKLQRHIEQENQTLCQAIRARLELANRNQNISDDDIVFDKIAKLRQDQLLPPPAADTFSPLNPRCTITLMLFYHFHCCLFDFDNFQAGFPMWRWFQSSSMTFVSYEKKHVREKIGLSFVFYKQGDHFFLLPKNDSENLRKYIARQKNLTAERADLCFQTLTQYNMAMCEYTTRNSELALAKGINHLISLEDTLIKHVADNKIQEAWQIAINAQKTLLITYVLTRTEECLQALTVHETNISAEWLTQLALSAPLLRAFWQWVEAFKIKPMGDEQLKFNFLAKNLEHIYKKLIHAFRTSVAKEYFLAVHDKNTVVKTRNNALLNTWFDYIDASITANETKNAFNLIRNIIFAKEYVEIPLFQSALKLLAAKEPDNSNAISDWESITLTLIRQIASNDFVTWGWLTAYQRQANPNLSITDAWIKDNHVLLTHAVLYLKTIFVAKEPALNTLLIDGKNVNVSQEFMKACYQTLQQAAQVHPDYLQVLTGIDDIIKNYIKNYDGNLPPYLIFLSEWSVNKDESVFANHVVKRFTAMFQTEPKHVIEDVTYQVMNAIRNTSPAVATALSQTVVKLFLAKERTQDQRITYLIETDRTLLRELIAKYLLAKDLTLIEIKIDEYYLDQLKNSLAKPASLPELEILCNRIKREYPLACFPSSDQVGEQLVKWTTAWLEEEWSLISWAIIRNFTPEKYQQTYHYVWLQQALTNPDFAKRFPDPYHDVSFFDDLSQGSTLAKLHRLYGVEATKVLDLFTQFIESPKVNELAWAWIDRILMTTNLSPNDQADELFEKFQQLHDRYNLIYKFKQSLNAPEGLVANLDRQKFVEAVSQLHALETSISLAMNLSSEAKKYLLQNLYLTITKNLKSLLNNAELTENEVFQYSQKFSNNFIKKLPGLSQRREWQEHCQWLCNHATTLYNFNHSLVNYFIQNQIAHQNWLLAFCHEKVLENISITDFLKFISDGMLPPKQAELLEKIGQIDMQGLNLYSAEALLSFRRLVSQQAENVEREQRCFANAVKLVRCLQLAEGQARTEKLAALKKGDMAAWINELQGTTAQSTLRQAKQHRWQKTLRQIFLGDGDHVASHELMEGVTRGKCKIHPDILVPLRQQLASVEKNEDSRHVVIPVQFHEDKVHFKFNPDLPGIEYAVRSFHRFSLDPTMSYSELLRFPAGTATQNAYPVLVSQDISGIRLDDYLNQHSILVWNLKAYTKRFLLTLLTNPLDGKPANEIVIPSEQSKEGKLIYDRAINIDNDQSFVPTLVKNKNQLKLNVKSIIFCFNEMNQEMNADIIKEFLALNPHTLMSAWLTDLQQQNDRYLQLFDPDLCDHLFYRDKDNPMIIAIPLPETLVADLYIKVVRIQNLLRGAIKENEPLTHLQLMTQLDPYFADFYTKALSTFTTPHERFYELFKNDYKVVQDEQKRLHFGTSSTARDTVLNIYGYVPEMKQLAASHHGATSSR